MQEIKWLMLSESHWEICKEFQIFLKNAWDVFL